MLGASRLSNVFSIRDVRGLLALDSRGSPTVKAIVRTEGGAIGKAIAPSGASRGAIEALELRDGGVRWAGRGVGLALSNINDVIYPRIKGLDVRAQRIIDYTLIALDGTHNKSRLGANTIVAVSLAIAKAASAQTGEPLYRYLGGVNTSIIPVPLMNFINGGVHAGNELSFQEFLVAPIGADSFTEALRIAIELYYALRELLKSKYGKSAINVGDEGGFAPPMRLNEDALRTLVDALRVTGYSESHVLLGLDVAANQIYDSKSSSYKVDGKNMSPGEFLDYIVDLISRYPIVYIEDSFHEEDFESFSKLTEKIGSKVLVVGDDLYATNTKYLMKGLEVKATNATLLKVNQIGTLTEAIDYANLAYRNGLKVVVSHRSGDSEDDFIADLAVALNTALIKTGAPARSERTAKYNRLIEIEEELGPTAVYPGSRAFI